MPNIKPVSDLRNYNKILDEVKPGEPVYLTKNGRGCYVVADVADIERFKKTEKNINLVRAFEEERRKAEAAGTIDQQAMNKEYYELLKSLDN